MSDKYLNYVSNPYNPFPIRLRGRYCEIPGSRSDTIGVISLDAKKTAIILKEDEADPWGWRKQMNLCFDGAALWIYQLEFFEVNCADIREDFDWNVADFAYNYQRMFFDALEKLVDHMHTEWSIGLTELKHDYEISVPLG